MVKTYTPEERDDRRRRSSLLSSAQRPSWMADLCAQGVDLDEFLKEFEVEVPEVIDVFTDELSEILSDSERSQGIESERLSHGQRRSILSKLSDRPDVNEKAKKRFSKLLGIPFDIDTIAGDLATKCLEEMSEEQWEREVKEDSKNYDPSSTTNEKIQQNREWALQMALQRAAEAGYKPAPDESEDTTSSAKSIYPKLDPPKTKPLPPIGEEDFNISEPPLDPRELGFFPPSLPHQLIDLIPKATTTNSGIVDGIIIHGTYEKCWESCDSNSIVVSCINCAAFLHCSRGASLVRCGNCNTVSPAYPGRSMIKHDDLAERKESSMDRAASDFDSVDTEDTNHAVRRQFSAPFD